MIVSNNPNVRDSDMWTEAKQCINTGLMKYFDSGLINSPKHILYIWE